MSAAGMTVLPQSGGHQLSESASPADFGAQVGQAVAQTGDELQNIQHTIVGHQVKMQELDNKTDSDAAWLGALKTDVGPIAAQYHETQGSAAYEGYNAFADKLEAARAKGADGLNPAAAALYNENSRRMTAYMLENGSMHAASERQKYVEATHTAKLQGYSDAAIGAFDNDAQFDDIQKQTAAEMHEYTAHTSGEPEIVTNQKIFAAQSANLKQRLITMSQQGQSAQAEHMFQQSIGQFTPADQLAVGRTLHAYSDAMNVQNGVDSIVGGHSAVPKDMDAFTNAWVKEESGFRAGVSGPMTASGQAHGLTQMLDGTAQATAIKLGIPWQPELMRGDSPEAAAYQMKLGKAHLSDLMQTYGNPAVALAAYNAGPGNDKNPRVDSWLQRFGDPSKGEISTQEWIDKIPFPETKKYVKDILNNSGGVTEGKPPTAEDPQVMKPQWIEAARHATDDPVHNAKLVSGVSAYADSITAAQRAARQQAHEALLTTIQGGQMQTDVKPTSLGQLLAMPGMQEQWAQTNAQDRKTLSAELAKNASGPRTATPAMVQNYHTINGIADNDPVRFSEMDILNEPDLTLGQKGSLLHRQRVQEAQNPHLMSALKLAQNVPGIPNRRDPNNPAAGPTQEWNNFTGRLADELSNFVDTNKRQPKDPEVLDMVTKLVQQQPDPESWFGGKLPPEYMKPRQPRPPQPRASGEDIQSIRNSFYKRTQRQPSEYEIQQIYNNLPKGK